MYREYPPDIRLSHLIETYWVADGVVEEAFTQRILPDGCVDIIFDFQSNNSTVMSQTESPKIVGTITSLLKVNYQVGPVQMMGIRFSPGGITALTNIPVSEFTNQNTDISLLETLFDKRFYERLPDMRHIQERINYLNHCFIARLHKFHIPDERIRHAVLSIRNNNGQATVKQIAGDVCLGERHFERKFRAAIGISPKMFSSIMRFQFACRYVERHAEDNLFDVAVSCGYYDLSHMNKDFQRFCNASPSDLIV